MSVVAVSQNVSPLAGQTTNTPLLADVSQRSSAESVVFQFPSKVEVVSLIHKVNDYWQERNPVHGNSFWNRAAYHTGNMAAYAATKDRRYRDFSEAWAIQNLWMGARSTNTANWKYSYGESNDYVLFGDYQICFQVYIDLYHLDPAEYKIARAREVMEFQMSTPNSDYWWWADGLYMVMPVMTRLHKITDNPLYLQKLYEYFMYADSIMYDPEVGLYYRDAKYVYPRHATINGLKDFWARGDGWVFGAFARTLADLPADDPYRQVYIQRYERMARVLADAQQPEGYWTRSLLDPAHAPGPETSGTAFFTYGYLWGINNGYLSYDEFGPTVHRAWDYLTNVALQSDGRVGYVQPIGENANPNQTVSATSTADFGVGAYLLAASEMLHLATGEMPERIIRMTAANVVSPYQIILIFSDMLNAVSAENVSNYTLNGKPFTGTAVYDGAYTVSLMTEQPINYGVVVVSAHHLTGHDGGVLGIENSREIYFSVPLTDPDPLVTVTAIGHQTGNPPQNTIDNLLNTRWSQPGLQQWIKYDLGIARQVSGVDIAFYLGNQRFSYFDIQISENDADYITVLQHGVSSGKTNGLERFTFQTQNARYVRIMGNGNSTGGDNWNSLTEVRILTDQFTGIETGPIQSPRLQVFPNPSELHQLVFQHSFSEGTPIAVRLLDMNGREQISRAMISNGSSVVIDGLSLQAGAYILQVTAAHAEERVLVLVR